MEKQDYLDQVDVAPVEEDERVQQIDEALDDNKWEIYDLGERRDELHEIIPPLETRVANLEADVEVGDATEKEFEEAKDELESLRKELEQTESRLDTLGKVRDRLKHKRRQAVEDASVEIIEQLQVAASDAMNAMIDALDDAEQARQRLSEIRDFARFQPDSVEIPAPASKLGTGIGLHAHNGRLERSHAQLKQTFGSDE